MGNVDNIYSSRLTRWNWGYRVIYLVGGPHVAQQFCWGGTKTSTSLNLMALPLSVTLCACGTLKLTCRLALMINNPCHPSQIDFKHSVWGRSVFFKAKKSASRRCGHPSDAREFRIGPPSGRFPKDRTTIACARFVSSASFQLSIRGILDNIVGRAVFLGQLRGGGLAEISNG